MRRTTDVADQVPDLVWSLVDEQATPEQIRHLEELIVGDTKARKTYVLCMQIHADLHCLFRKRPLRLPFPLVRAGTGETNAACGLPAVNLSQNSAVASLSGRQ
jgi:hypothetical protein